MNLMNAFEIQPREGILYNQGAERKYRFNRKEGKIFLDLVSTLQPIGSSLDTLVLQHFGFSASLFNMPFQNWVMLAFVDSNDVVSIGYLNSGSTDATRAWDAYVLNLESQSTPLATVITTISFQQEFSKSTGNSWFNYKFESKPRKTEKEIRQFEQAKAFMMEYQPVLIDRNLDKEIAESLFLSATGATRELKPAEVDEEIDEEIFY